MNWKDVATLLGEEAAGRLRQCVPEPGALLFGDWDPRWPLPAELRLRLGILRNLVVSPGRAIRCPGDIWERVAYLGARTQEAVVILYLNGRNRVLSAEELFRGTATGASVSPREVFRGALIAGAVGVLVAHNHPSGEVEPSIEDDDFTRRLERGGRMVGVPLVDHIIVGRGTYFSYREAGRIIRCGPGRRASSKRPSRSPGDRCPSSENTSARPEASKRWAPNH